MNHSISPSPAEISDRNLQLVAGSMFFVALLFGVSVVEFFVDEAVAGYLDIAIKILALGTLGLGVVLFVGKFRVMNAAQRRRCLEEDGFLQQSFQRAMAKSWMFSFVLLVFLQALDQLVLERLPEIPLDVIIQALLAIMLGVFSIAFFTLTRTGSAMKKDGLG